MEKTGTNNRRVYYDIQLKQEEANTFLKQEEFAVKLFHVLCGKNAGNCKSISLCTRDGRILASYPASTEAEIKSGTEPSPWLSENNAADYTITGVPDSSDFSKIEAIQDAFSQIMSLFLHNEKLREFIFRGLDVLPNSIHICNKEMELIYANSDCCSYMHLDDREKAYGRPIDEILQEVGVKFIAVKGHREQGSHDAKAGVDAFHASSFLSGRAVRRGSFFSRK